MHGSSVTTCQLLAATCFKVKRLHHRHPRLDTTQSPGDDNSDMADTVTLLLMKCTRTVQVRLTRSSGTHNPAFAGRSLRESMLAWY